MLDVKPLLTLLLPRAGFLYVQMLRAACEHSQGGVDVRGILIDLGLGHLSLHEFQYNGNLNYFCVTDQPYGQE